MTLPKPTITAVIEADLVVVGAGFAGVTTAWKLAQKRKVVLLEKEGLAGMHSSGRNAAMVRQVTSDEAVSAMARAGAEYIRGLSGAGAPGGCHPIFRPTGSLLVGGGPKREQLERDIACAHAAGLPHERLAPGEAKKRFPVLQDAAFEVACFTPGDGVVDLAGLVNHYLRAAEASGAHVLLNATAEEVLFKHGRIHGIRTGSVEVHTSTIVNAAGPWAPEVAALAGAARIPLRPRRRHVFVTRAPTWASPDWPFIWDVTEEVYFRPEDGGLLFSPCDETEPGDKDSDAADPRARETLDAKLSRQFPSLRGLPLIRSWSGLRTLTPDGRFVIGPDPRLPGFFWVAGLGGHGVTSSAAAGRLAAELVLRPEMDADNPHSPSRFFKA